MKNKLLFLCFSFLASFFSLAQKAPNYSWPVKTGNTTSHRAIIVGTPSEYRTPYNGAGWIFQNYGGYSYPLNQHRFHRGVDIVGDEGNVGRVYSIENGSHVVHFESSGYNGRSLLNNMVYWHTDLANGIINGVSNVNTDDYFCDYVSSAEHLHMNELNGGINANVLVNKMPNYEDCSPVTIVANSTQFRENGANITTPSVLLPTLNGVTTLYGKLDLILETSDERTAASCQGTNSGNIGANQVGYDLLQNGNSVINGPIFDVNFSDFPDNAAASSVFFQGTTISRYNYILTSSPRTVPFDRYWNTKLKSNIIQNWPTNGTKEYLEQDAKCPDESVTKDGQYIVRFYARDVDVTNYNEDTEDKNVIVDNFKPYIKSVVIKAAGQKIYEGRWECDAVCGGVKYKEYVNLPNLLSMSSYNDLQIIAETSEPLTTQYSVPGNTNSTKYQLSLKFLDNTTIFYAKSSASNANEFVFNLNSPSAQTVTSLVLSFKGKDLANNDLINLANFKNTCVKIPTRNGANSFDNPSKVPDGLDETFVLPCPLTDITLNTTTVLPTDCNKADGKITVVNKSYNGFGNPVWQWFKCDNQTPPQCTPLLPVTLITPLVNLTSGKYCLKASAVGCEATKCIDLKAKNQATLTYEIVANPCPNGSNGIIKVFATNADPNVKYTFSSAQYTFPASAAPSNTVNMVGLKAGAYIVKATNGNCVDEILIELSNDVNQPPVFTLEGTNPCKGAKNGKVIVKVGSINKVQWSTDPPNPPGNTGPTAKFNLGVGTYTVTVTNECGKTLSKSIELKEVGVATIKTDTKDCKSDLSVDFPNANPPVKYFWTYGQVSKEPILKDIKTNSAQVSVTDANGCTGFASVDETPYYKFVKQDACSGATGEMYLYIHNPSGATPLSGTALVNFDLTYFDNLKSFPSSTLALCCLG